MQPVLGFLARVEHRAVDPLRGHADEASALAVGDPEPFRLVRAALASSRGCVACFSAGASLAEFFSLSGDAAPNFGSARPGSGSGAECHDQLREARMTFY
jgi:hypothetical protein